MKNPLAINGYIIGAHDVMLTFMTEVLQVIILGICMVVGY